MKRKSRTKRATTNDLNQNLKIKGRKLETFKSPPPRRLNRMLQATNSQADCQDLDDNEHHSPPYDKPANITYPLNKMMMISFPSASPDIVSLDMFFRIPTHLIMLTH